MKYKYPNGEIFECRLDINSFTQQINLNKQAYRHIRGIENYIDTWRTVLLNAYAEERNLYCPLTCGGFHTSLFLGQSEIRLHFNIDEASRLISRHHIRTLYVSDFSESADSGAPIRYSHCDLPTNYPYETCGTPIIIVPYYFGGFRYLVIDGNHRVTARMRSAVKTVPGVILTPIDASSLISSAFERGIYTFICEGEKLQESIRHSNVNRF